MAAARWRPWKTIPLKYVFKVSRKSFRETKELVFSEPTKLPAMRMAFDFLAKRSIFWGQALMSVTWLGSGPRQLEVMEQSVWRPLTFYHIWCRLWLLFTSPVAPRTLKTAGSQTWLVWLTARSHPEGVLEAPLCLAQSQSSASVLPMYNRACWLCAWHTKPAVKHCSWARQSSLSQWWQWCWWLWQRLQ